MKKNHLNKKTLLELHRSGQLTDAKEGYLRLLKSTPRDIELLHSLGILCAQQENFDEASEYLQKALKIQPKNLQIMLHLANILKIQGLFSHSAQILEEAIAIDPDFIAALNNLGTVFYAQGKLADAVRCYQTAIDKQPDFADAYYNLGLALVKKNDLDAAESIFKKLISLAPKHFAAHFHLACLYMQQEKIDAAIHEFLHIEEMYPNHFETETNLATCLLKKGNLNDAKLHYFKALELKPDDIQVLFNLGVINMQQGYVDAAIQYYQRAVQQNPNDFALQNNLAVAFLVRRHINFATHHFQEALRIQPGNTSIQHILDLLAKDQHLLTSPPEYIRSLFDAYADHYEPHLLKALEYKVPELLRDAVFSVRKPQAHQWNILDLGCGTGLCGAILKPYAKKLDGVDLSPKMLEVAREKNIYDNLVDEDLSQFLSKKNSDYDLIVAGDVLVYTGDLSTIFQNAYQALVPSGLFAFNTEISEDDDFKMNQSGRFCHHKNYIEKLAKQFQFNIVHYDTSMTRMQNNEPVYGHLFVLEKK